MGRQWKWLRKACALVLLVALTAQSFSAAQTIVKASEAAAEDQYEIYPTPQSVTYGDDTFIIRSSVNIVYEDGIDDVTKQKLDEVLASKGVSGNVSDEIVNGTTNILVGVYDSNGYVDQYAKENIDFSEEIFTHIDPYVLSIQDGTITVLGETTDAAFYGIVSFMHILNQIDGKTIRNLVIEDYADTETRGFIEGYYGVPWSNEDRMSLMEFGGQFKMTSYIFAPKDDPYHSSQWRTLYPEEELAEIAEMAAVGNANKCRFVWTIHPFMYSAISADTYDEDIDVIIAKFEQLYEVGVRQFGVLGDDAGSLSRDVVIDTMTDLQEWVDSKGDVYDLVFCPAGYNHSWQGDYSELNDYDAGFPEGVQIFWTGEAVCQPVEQTTLDHFRRYNLEDGQEDRRSPLFWLNWPVNDINMSRLLMGKGSLLENDVNPDDLSGVVTNPMQDAQGSKVALFAVADYAWNIGDFDDDQSWADSFKYIDAEASEELYTLAKHMSDPSPNGHGLVLDESTELQPLLDEFAADYEAGTYNEELAEELISEFEVIMEACDDFHKLSQNESLKEEVLPFSNALKDLSEAIIGLINTAKALEDGDSANVWSYYSAATAKLADSENYDRVTLSGTQAALPGSKRLRPFAEKLNEILAVSVNNVIDDSKLVTTLFTNRTDTPDGALDSLTDNNEATEVIWKSPNSTTAGTYIGLKYSKAITLNDVTFKMGQSGNARDTFDAAKIQYTVDGKTWEDLEGSAYSDMRATVTVDGLNLQVKGIRLISTADKENMWLGCKDIIVNIDSYTSDDGDEDAEPLNKTLIRSSSWSVYDGSESALTDGSVSSGVWYNTQSNGNVSLAGEYLGMDLGEVVNVGKVTFAVGLDGGDKWTSYQLEYSTDNTNWTTYNTYTGVASGQDVHEENLNGAEARYVRIKNLEDKASWIKFGEFDVERNVTGNAFIYTNVSGLGELGTTNTEDKISIDATENITLQPGEYLGVKLERIKDISNIAVTSIEGLTLQSSKNEIVWTTVEAPYEDARYVRLINQTDANITFNLTQFDVESVEIFPISVEDTNYGNEATHLYAFDQDRTTEAILEGSQYAGYYITYDLGQVIELNSLKLVLHDGTTDYPRHAKVSVSEDGQSWTEIMLIGDQEAANPGEAENTDNISELFPEHEISYYTKLADGFQEQVRYIKFEITRNKAGADKWVRIREIELNGGDIYLQDSNDPTTVTTGVESKGNTAANLTDGDVSTTFEPVGTAGGTTTVNISENTQIKKITVLQSPSTISNATVSVEAVRNGAVETVVIGKLASSLNEFNVSDFDHVLSVEIDWEENQVPKIHEIVTATADVQTANKDTLEAYYEAHKSENTSNWTAESKEIYADAVALAKEIIENTYATQSGVDSAYIGLKNAVEDHVEIGNIAAFKLAVNEIEDDVLTSENYTAKSWAVYAEELSAAKAVNNDSQLSQEELNTLLANLEAAKSGLVYEITAMEELTLLHESLKDVGAGDYDSDSYEAFTVALNEAEELIEAGKTERQNPVEVRAALSRLETAYANLGEDIEVPVEPDVPDSGYAVSLLEDAAVNVGEDVEVDVCIYSQEETYNTYHYVLTYDPDVLTFKSVSDGATASDAQGTLTILGYGADKPVSEAVTVTFTGKAPGDADITLEMACVDKAENALTQNAPAGIIENGTVSIEVGGYMVSLSDDFTGSGAVNAGEDYTFRAKDLYYTYEFTATMGGSLAEVIDNGDGSYTIENVTGDLVITAVKTPMSFDVDVEGSGAADVILSDDTATYRSDYTFELNRAEGYNYTVTVTIGGQSYSPSVEADGTYEISGSDIRGDIVITVTKTAASVDTTQIIFTGNGSGDVVGSNPAIAQNDQDFTFSIDKEEFYDYTVRLEGSSQELTANSNGVYTINQNKLTGGTLTVVITKTSTVETAVEVTEYVKVQDGKSIFLITVTGPLDDGEVFAYDGNAMSYSEAYEAYAYLVISDKSLAEVQTEAETMITEITADLLEIDYSGDVNGTGLTDVNDAQLAYNMYNAYYNDFNRVSMEKFLRADMNHDRTLTVLDSAAIVEIIK